MWIRVIAGIVLLGLVGAVGYLVLQLQEQDRQMAAILAEKKQKEEQEAAAKAAAARLTPTQFGFYIAQGQDAIRPMQLMSAAKYLEPPTFMLKPNTLTQLVLYDRVFSTVAPQQMFVSIVAKIKNESGWFIRDRGYNIRLSPRVNNRDILDAFVSYKPGRYAIKTLSDGQYYSFAIEGENNDPDFCVEGSTTQGLLGGIHRYTVCSGGTPD